MVEEPSATKISGAKIPARLQNARQDGGSIFRTERLPALPWRVPVAFPVLARAALRRARLVRVVDLDLVAFLVDVDVFVLVPALLLAPAPLLPVGIGT